MKKLLMIFALAMTSTGLFASVNTDVEYTDTTCKTSEIKIASDGLSLSFTLNSVDGIQLDAPIKVILNWDGFAGSRSDYFALQKIKFSRNWFAPTYSLLATAISNGPDLYTSYVSNLVIQEHSMSGRKLFVCSLDQRIQN